MVQKGMTGKKKLYVNADTQFHDCFLFPTNLP